MKFKDLKSGLNKNPRIMKRRNYKSGGYQCTYYDIIYVGIKDKIVIIEWGSVLYILTDKEFNNKKFQVSDGN